MRMSLNLPIKNWLLIVRKGNTLAKPILGLGVALAQLKVSLGFPPITKANGVNPKKWKNYLRI